MSKIKEDNEYTSEERKLLKATKKLERKTQKYLNDLTEIDTIIGGCSIQTARSLDLEKTYFKNISAVVRAAIQLELLHSRVQAGLSKFDPDSDETNEDTLDYEQELASYRMHSLS